MKERRKEIALSAQEENTNIDDELLENQPTINSSNEIILENDIYPSHLAIEGHDQHPRWFMSSYLSAGRYI